MVNTTNKLKQMTAYDTFDIDGWNGELFDEDYCSDKTIDEIIDNALKDPWYCDYCLTKLLKVEDQVHEEGNYRDYCLWYCRKCRFWQACFRPDPSRYDIPPPDFHAYISKLREFDTNLPEGCSEELALYIRRHPISYIPATLKVLRNSLRMFSEPITRMPKYYTLENPVMVGLMFC